MNLKLICGRLSGLDLPVWENARQQKTVIILIMIIFHASASPNLNIKTEWKKMKCLNKYPVIGEVSQIVCCHRFGWQPSDFWLWVCLVILINMGKWFFVCDLLWRLEGLLNKKGTYKVGNWNLLWSHPSPFYPWQSWICSCASDYYLLKHVTECCWAIFLISCYKIGVGREVEVWTKFISLQFKEGQCMNWWL